jgi:spectinomycin phosphotransferase
MSELLSGCHLFCFNQPDTDYYRVIESDFGRILRENLLSSLIKGLTFFRMTELTHLIINWLSIHYWIEATALVLLPLGADPNASIYKVHASDQKTYFVKLKRDHFHDTNIEVLELLQMAGIQQLIPPIKTVAGTQIQQVNDFTLIVYPFVEGQDGFNCPLTDKQWVVLGRALKQVHEVDVPPSLKARIRREEFSPKWRDVVRSLYTHIEAVRTDDEIASNLWKFLQENKSIIQQLLDRSEQLSQKACSHPLKFVLCHSDIHGGNVLVNDTEALYIVDWDDPILAPKERDLMFIGGGVGNVWNKPYEERLFYQGYGQVDVDWTLLAYYRYERIVEDIAVYSQELLLKPMEGNNRLEMYKQFMSIFEPHGVVDIAFATDKQHVVK